MVSRKDLRLPLWGGSTRFGLRAKDAAAGAAAIALLVVAIAPKAKDVGAIARRTVQGQSDHAIILPATQQNHCLRVPLCPSVDRKNSVGYNQRNRRFAFCAEDSAVYDLLTDAGQFGIKRAGQ